MAVVQIDDPSRYLSICTDRMVGQLVRNLEVGDLRKQKRAKSKRRQLFTNVYRCEHWVLVEDFPTSTIVTILKYNCPLFTYDGDANTSKQLIISNAIMWYCLW